MYVVYAIKSRNKNFIYVWMTNNLSRRIYDHQNWKNISTKAYAPFDIVYTEECENSLEARKREKYWKSGFWKKTLKDL